jgi:flagella basal body P-ring formation protein FlgA
MAWKQALVQFLARVGVTGTAEILACAPSQPTPSGLEIDSAKLQHVGGDRYLWRTQLADGSGVSVLAWVRFQGKFSRQVCIATRDLTARSLLSDGDCEMQSRPAVLAHRDPVLEGGITGMELRRSIQKGGEIRPADLIFPVLVRQGQSIRVLVVGSAAEIGFEAISKQNGRSGDAVLLENPVSRRAFRAIVKAPGLALVRISNTEGAQ